MRLCTLCLGNSEVRPARFTLDTTSTRPHGPAGGEYDLCQRCRSELWRVLGETTARLSAFPENR